MFEWQEDSLAAAANNAQVEGAAFTAGTLSATTMRTNNTQILSKVFEVSATADAVKTYDIVVRKKLLIRCQKHSRKSSVTLNVPILAWITQPSYW